MTHEVILLGVWLCAFGGVVSKEVTAAGMYGLIIIASIVSALLI